MKSTAIAPSNIAFIKYWGMKDSAIFLPCNSSISMNLSNLLTKTTIEFSEEYKEDKVYLNGIFDEKVTIRAKKQIDLLRTIAGVEIFAKIVSENNFPTSTGLSSSASGFAALTVATAGALGLRLSEKELTILTRKSSSGSASRSIPDGFVEWKEGSDDATSYAYSMNTPDHWDIIDVIAVVSSGPKDVATIDGHKLAYTSPFFETRINKLKNKVQECKKHITEKNFIGLGELCEAEALELHAIMITSTPSLIYWLPQTVLLMKFVQHLRRDGLPVYFTLNTGQDVHILVQTQHKDILIKELHTLDYVNKIIENRASKGAHLIEDHLF
ncbi:MAG: diphosphomevalonate decarboxylase [Candidatus Roizmanbacteria bacterium]